MTRNDPQRDARIEDLQARVAQQDHALLELSDEVYRHQQQLAQLEAQLRHLAERLSSAGAAESGDSLRTEVPPHY